MTDKIKSRPKRKYVLVRPVPVTALLLLDQGQVGNIFRGIGKLQTQKTQSKEKDSQSVFFSLLNHRRKKSQQKDRIVKRLKDFFDDQLLNSLSLDRQPQAIKTVLKNQVYKRHGRENFRSQQKALFNYKRHKEEEAKLSSYLMKTAKRSELNLLFRKPSKEKLTVKQEKYSWLNDLRGSSKKANRLTHNSIRQQLFKTSYSGGSVAESSFQLVGRLIKPNS